MHISSPRSTLPQADYCDGIYTRYNGPGGLKRVGNGGRAAGGIVQSPVSCACGPIASTIRVVRPACPIARALLGPRVRTSIPATPDSPPASCLHPHADNHSPSLQHSTSPRPRCCVLLVDCQPGGRSATTIPARQRALVEREVYPNERGEERATREQECCRERQRQRAAGG
ncbi:hypothetical protein DFH09DRAFT_1296027 [Mycena vulgaris]|nr:hypothetical protein DFH09DRAFT_1296027 [Mycena vulgaris]